MSKSGSPWTNSTPSTVRTKVDKRRNTTKFYPRGHHHVLNVVVESPDKDGFSTSGWARDHAGKRVGQRHEVIQKSSTGYFKHEWVARRVNKVRFLCFGLVL